MGVYVTFMGLKTGCQKNELKKHIAIIHCMNTLSLLQRKISNALLYHAYPNLQTQDEHEITIKQLCNIINYNGHNHAVIKNALKGLISTVIEWDVIDSLTGEEDWTASTMLASVNLKGPVCRYSYSTRLKSLLYTPSMYGKINLYIQAKFSSSYGLALYENCIRYKGLANTRWFDLEIFRKLMGVPDGMYPIYRDLKKRVLDKSIEEVNNFSDIYVEPEISRVGQKVNAIRFLIKNISKKNLLDQKHNDPNIIEYENNDLEDNLNLLNKVTSSFGIKRENVIKFINEYGYNHVERIFELVETSSSYTQGKINNIAAYFIKAIKDNYQPPKSSKLNNEARQIEIFVNEKKEREDENLKYQLDREYSTYVFDYIMDKIDLLPEEQQKDIYKNFESSLNGKGYEFISKTYKLRGLESSVVKSVFINFIKVQNNQLITDITAYEEFSSKMK